VGSPSLTALRGGGNRLSIEASGVPLCTSNEQDRMPEINLHYQGIE
jgi:hypothetical protein